VHGAFVALAAAEHKIHVRIQSIYFYGRFSSPASLAMRPRLLDIASAGDGR
jgi:hypothetical protein